MSVHSPSSLNLTYETMLTTTLMKVLNTGAIEDQVYDANPLWDWLRTENRIKVLDGGERLRIPIMTGKNSTAGSYSGYDILDTTAQDVHTTAFFNWKYYSVSVSVNGPELRNNGGSKEKVADIQAVKIESASNSLTDKLATDVYLDGTGNSNKNLTGLAAMIETAPGTVAYADVPVANTYWQNKVQASVGSGVANLIPSMRTLFNDCKQGKGASGTGIDYAVTTQAVHEVAESLIEPRIRYAPSPSGQGADLGMTENPVYKGAEIVWSDFCPSGTLFALNSNHIMLFVHRDANFTMAEGGFMRTQNQDAYIAQILFQGNLTTNNRRKLGKLTGIS